MTLLWFSNIIKTCVCKQSQHQQNTIFWEENWKFLVTFIILNSSSLKFKFVFITGQVKFWAPIPSPAISTGQRLEPRFSITLAGLSLISTPRAMKMAHIVLSLLANLCPNVSKCVGFQLFLGDSNVNCTW